MYPKWLGLGVGALAGTAAAATALAWWGNRCVDKWENLNPEDAGEGEFITLSDGARMHYVARPVRSPAGVLQDVILIHGLMDSAFHWHKNMDAVATTHRVFAIDLVGFGFSSRPTTLNYSTKTFARHVRELMDRCGIERASLVGHSLGGAVALEFAHDYPERVHKLILISPATLLLQVRPVIPWAIRLPRLSRAVMGWAMTSPGARARGWRTALGDPARIDWDEQPIRDRPNRVKGTTDALVAMLSSPPETDLPRELGRIAAPTLILWGSKDRAVPLLHGRILERLLPHARLVVLQYAGHIPQSEYPERVNRLILDFLATTEDLQRQ